MNPLRMVFMGSPEFALPTLAALLAAGHQVACVYTQPPRPARRGQKERRSPVHALAGAKGLAVRTPASLKDEGEQAAFKALNADAAVVVAYGLKLPKAIVAAPRLGCLNVHASLLPRWRGAAPIQRAILEGDTETGVTIMRIDEGLDTGPIIIAEKVPIGPRATAAMLHDQLAELGARLMVKALDGLVAGMLKPTPQPATGVTVAPKLGRDDGRLDWRRPAAALERQVRAFNPWPGAWFEHAGHRMKVLAAAVEAGSGVPGALVDDALGVACGAGVLRLIEVQRAGRAAQPAAAFLRGFPMPAGVRLA
ncbi:MAG TPA: methionyl-tRNA formyltransferase [Rhodospirillales bacterium]